MALDYVMSGILAITTVIIALVICYAFFENNFQYFLYFELIFLTLFWALNIIDYLYITVIILIFAIILYRLIVPELNKRRDET